MLGGSSDASAPPRNLGPAAAFSSDGSGVERGSFRMRGANINTNVNTNVVGKHGSAHAGPREVSVKGFNNNTNINTNVVNIDYGLKAWGKAATAYWNAVAAFWGVRYAPASTRRAYDRYER